jgi:hypothetical protein
MYGSRILTKSDPDVGQIDKPPKNVDADGEALRNQPGMCSRWILFPGRKSHNTDNTCRSCGWQYAHKLADFYRMGSTVQPLLMKRIFSRKDDSRKDDSRKNDSRKR